MGILDKVNEFSKYKKFLDTDDYKVCGLTKGESEVEIIFYHKETNKMESIYLPLEFKGIDLYHVKSIIKDYGIVPDRINNLIANHSEIHRIRVYRQRLDDLNESFVKNTDGIRSRESIFKAIDKRFSLMEHLLNCFVTKTIENRSATYYLQIASVFPNYNVIGTVYDEFCILSINPFTTIIKNDDLPLEVYNKVMTLIIDVTTVINDDLYKDDVQKLKDLSNEIGIPCDSILTIDDFDDKIMELTLHLSDKQNTVSQRLSHFRKLYEKQDIRQILSHNKKDWRSF